MRANSLARDSKAGLMLASIIPSLLDIIILSVRSSCWTVVDLIFFFFCAAPPMTAPKGPATAAPSAILVRVGRDPPPLLSTE